MGKSGQDMAIYVAIFGFILVLIFDSEYRLISILKIIKIPSHKENKKNIIIGSSMGGWISLIVTKKNLNHIHGVIGIASAPDFIVEQWDKLSKNEQLEFKKYSEEKQKMTLAKQEKGWLVIDIIIEGLKTSGSVKIHNFGKHLRDFINIIPDDKLFIETDSPYLSPYISSKRPEITSAMKHFNKPEYLVEVAKDVAKYRNQSYDHICEITYQNYLKFFGINR